MCGILMDVLHFITESCLEASLCRANIAIQYEIKFKFGIGLTL
jgi:hypothetical protein